MQMTTENNKQQNMALEKMQVPKDLTDLQSLQQQISLEKQASKTLAEQYTKNAMEAMKMVLIRRQEDSGQKQLDTKILAFRVHSFVRHMEAMGVTPDRYDEVYEIAAQIYNSKELK